MLKGKLDPVCALKGADGKDQSPIGDPGLPAGEAPETPADALTQLVNEESALLSEIGAADFEIEDATAVLAKLDQEVSDLGTTAAANIIAGRNSRHHLARLTGQAGVDQEPDGLTQLANQEVPKNG